MLLMLRLSLQYDMPFQSKTTALYSPEVMSFSVLTGERSVSRNSKRKKKKNQIKFDRCCFVWKAKLNKNENDMLVMKNDIILAKKTTCWLLHKTETDIVPPNKWNNWKFQKPKRVNFLFVYFKHHFKSVFTLLICPTLVFWSKITWNGG